MKKRYLKRETLQNLRQYKNRYAESIDFMDEGFRGDDGLFEQYMQSLHRFSKHTGLSLGKIVCLVDGDTTFEQDLQNAYKYASELKKPS